MTKNDKYNLFDRECPFKEEWLNPNDKIRYEEIRKKKYEKKSK